MVRYRPVLWIGLCFGGSAQLIAGLMEFKTGNNFGFCAFTGYGAFWISLCLMVIFGKSPDLVKSYPTLAFSANDLGFFLVAWTIFTAILFIACAQVALLVVWRLLSMINGGVIFTGRALRWVDVITGCGAVGTVLGAGVLIHLLAVVGVHWPPVLWLIAIVAGGLAFVLLMIVMRGLLESAIADRSELDGVI
jgi:hypothetical protein